MAAEIPERRKARCVGLVVPLTALAVVAAAERKEEYEVKAALLVKLLKFVEWDEGPPGGEAFVIGIVGEDPFGDHLDPAREAPIAGRTAEIVRLGPYREGTDLSRCHVVFIARQERRHLGSILLSVEGRGVLTIGDMEGFLEEGGVINLVIKDDRVGFEINQQAAAARGIRIAAAILAKATRVIRKS